MSLPLQHARKAIADCIDDEMVGQLCRETLASADPSDASLQQQEHRVLSTLHASLHKVLAAARQAPSAQTQQGHANLLPTVAEEDQELHAPDMAPDNVHVN